MAAPAPAGNKSHTALHLADHDDDEYGNQKGYIRGTDYSLPYTSQWSRMSIEDDAQKKLLRNLNCSWLSTHGSPPTLLALKQHAQSLCILIHALCPSVKSSEINAGSSEGGEDVASPRRRLHVSRTTDPLAMKYELNDAFDFLADLNRPYDNKDPNHLKPLNILANEVRKRDELSGTEYHCPYAHSKPRDKGERIKPYANHHNLLVHANACLERLDHEFSATGGVLGILPTAEEHDTHELRSARNSLVGQWIVFTQHLVARMHELERSYANALDALSGEAAIPRQYLSSKGTERRSAHEIAFPQDRWIMANAGDDVFQLIHGLLDKQEALGQAEEAIWKNNGVSSARGWTEQRGTPSSASARSLVYVDANTRYYRIAGQGHNTVFVMPAWEHHPAVEYTRKIEREPTIVSTVQPKFPVRATDFEKRYNERLKKASELEEQNHTLSRRNQVLEAQVHTLEADNERERELNSAFVNVAGSENIDVAKKMASELARARRETDNAKEQLRQLDAEKGLNVARREALETQITDLRAEKKLLQERLANLGASADVTLDPTGRHARKASGGARTMHGEASDEFDLDDRRFIDQMELDTLPRSLRARTGRSL